MKFAVKFSDGNYAWWEEFDKHEVSSQRDAFLYGKVLVEYWNSDLRPGEFTRKVLNATLKGPGKARRRLPSSVVTSQEIH